MGLQWKKAVTIGPGEELEGFLLKVFRIETPEIKEEPTGVPGQTRSIYYFPSGSRRNVMPISTDSKPDGDSGDLENNIVEESTESAPVNVVRDDVESDESLMQEDVEPPQDDVSGSETATDESGADQAPDFDEEAELPHSEQPGAISLMILKKDSLAPVRLNAELVAHDVDVSAKIYGLGVEELLVESPFVLVDQRSVITVRFHVKARQDKLPIECTCKLLESAEGKKMGTLALDLEITGIDEGDRPGVLARYIKWLHFHAMARE